MTGKLTGVLGNSGSYGQNGLLDMALRLAISGTLTLRYPSGTRLLLISNGRLKSSFDLGEPGGEDDGGVEFHFEPHHATDVPQLSSPASDSRLGVLRALPVLGPAQALIPGLVDLRSLVSRAKEEKLTAALTLDSLRSLDGSPAERGVALFHEGRIGAAAYEREGHVWERSDALRAIYRYSLEVGRPAMELHPLDGALMRSLLGMALERRAPAADPSNFTGITAGEAGYTYFCDGKAILHLSAQLLGSSGRYSPLEVVPDLELPDDPPGWERRRFDLTLRGRDALNPMTELSMQFSDNYGVNGRRVLEAVRRGLSIEDTAARLELDLQALKPWLERLEQDGLIRPRG